MINLQKYFLQWKFYPANIQVSAEATAYLELFLSTFQFLASYSPSFPFDSAFNLFDCSFFSTFKFITAIAFHPAKVHYKDALAFITDLLNREIFSKVS